ncbi:MAG: flagellar biosynthesis anti-sigma factor FlgM [Verrucomicrobiota bacterium]
MNIDSSSSAPLASYLQQSNQSQKANQASEAQAVPSKKANAADSTGLRVSDLERIQSYVDKLKQMPDVRQEKVAQAKNALEAGDYDTQPVIDEVARRLMEEI